MLLRPLIGERFQLHLELKNLATPAILRKTPIHRWFWFPQSFSPQLLDVILHRYPLSRGGRILDPFVGSGTTALRAVELGYQATGIDFSPLAVFVSQVKVNAFMLKKETLEKYLTHILHYKPLVKITSIPRRIARAFTHRELAHLLGLRERLSDLPEPYADFFLLVLLRIQQNLSRAISDGGWFRWIKKPDQSHKVHRLFEKQVRQMMRDIPQTGSKLSHAEIIQDDARKLERVHGLYDMVLTSPPYPNRHDYTRVFHLPLLMLGLREDEIRSLRHGSLRSHVEARAGYPIVEYTTPQRLIRILDALPDTIDRRVPAMIRGYFEDIYLTLMTIRKHLKEHALCAFVVGNVRHGGVMVPVDEILIDIGKQAGYTFEEAWVVRLKGNSAQQMGRYGRVPARETIVLMRRG